MKIVILPGHQPTSPGYINRQFGLEEHREAAKISDIVCDLLAGGDHEVYSPRGTPEDILAFVNGFKPDIAVEIHFGYSKDPDTKGVATVYDDNPESEKLATCLHTALIQRLCLGDTGLGKYDNANIDNVDLSIDDTDKYYIVQYLGKCVNCVIKPLHLSSERDCHYLLESGTHEKIAEIIAHVVTDYIAGGRRMERMSVKKISKEDLNFMVD